MFAARSSPLAIASEPRTRPMIALVAAIALPDIRARFATPTRAMAPHLTPSHTALNFFPSATAVMSPTVSPVPRPFVAALNLAAPVAWISTSTFAFGFLAILFSDFLFRFRLLNLFKVFHYASALFSYEVQLPSLVKLAGCGIP